MRDEVNSLVLQRDNILILLAEYDRKIFELNEKIKYEDNPVEIETVKEALKIKDNSKKLSCSFYRKGYCKKGIDCKYNHKSEDCVRYLELSRCEDINCNLRHRKDCKYWKRGYCFRGYSCAYLHKVSRSVGDEIKVAKTVVEENETGKVQDRNSFQQNKVKEENDYLKKQITKLRDRNLKLDIKVLKNSDIHDINEEEMKTIKDKNTKLLKRLKEEVLKRIRLETEIEHLKRRLGEEMTESESD